MPPQDRASEVKNERTPELLATQITKEIRCSNAHDRHVEADYCWLRSRNVQVAPLRVQPGLGATELLLRDSENVDLSGTDEAFPIRCEEIDRPVDSRRLSHDPATEIEDRCDVLPRVPIQIGPNGVRVDTTEDV